MNTLRAVIIDDETAAVNALKLLIAKHVKDVAVIAGTTDCTEGISLIENQKPDIVFLDVSMPDMSGFSLVKQLAYKNFDLIFVTAYERYAIQALKLHVSDFLVKPIDIDELKQAVENILKMRIAHGNEHTRLFLQPELQHNSRIALPVREGLTFVNIADIIQVESSGSYSIFHCVDKKKYMVSKNIGEYEQMLPTTQFFRVHKSHLVNLKKVKKYVRIDGYYVEMEDGSFIEIARRKKDELLQLLLMESKSNI